MCDVCVCEREIHTLILYIFSIIDSFLMIWGIFNNNINKANLRIKTNTN